jgi:hypothetical protein
MQKISVCMLYATLQCSRAPVLYAGGSLYWHLAIWELCC